MYIRNNLLQLDHVFCHVSTIRFPLKKCLAFSQLLFAGPEYITFVDLNILILVRVVVSCWAKGVLGNLERTLNLSKILWKYL